MNQKPVLICSNYYQHLLQPLSQDNPCGENLEYVPDFIMLQSRLQPKLAAEYGDFVEAAEPINWTETERECLDLLQKSKDVRLIIILMRCRLRRIGLAAIAEGTEVLAALLSIWPDDLHPQLLDEGEFTPILRANAFAELEDPEGLITDIRNQLLPKAAGLQITLREFEKAHLFSREPGTLSETAVTGLIHEWHLNAQDALRPLVQAYHFVVQIKQTLVATLKDEAPELATLTAILALFCKEFGSLEPVSEQAVEVTPSASIIHVETNASSLDETSESAPKVVISDPAPQAPIQTLRRDINNRADALQTIKEVRSWFGMTEPSSPLILLLKYAEDSIGRNFADLTKMYPPEIIAILSQEKE